MSIQKFITEISRSIGSLEVVHHTRIGKSIVKQKDLLCGAYILDDSIELKGATSAEISIERNKFFRYDKIGTNVYRFSNKGINILIRPIEY